MCKEPEPMPAGVGSFTVEVYGAGRHGRRRASRFTVRCHAVGLHDDEVLLLSVAGPETSVKALTAGLRASATTQERLAYSAQVGDVCRAGLVRCPDGYRVYRTKLNYGLWHVLCLARRAGFLPVLTEDAVWQLLRAEPFTTPLLRVWVPWLCQEMQRRQTLVPLTQSGCQAGLFLADHDTLDALVGEGIQQGHLAIPGPTAGWQGPSEEESVRTLDDYLHTYGPLLGRQAERSLHPLHVPGRDPLPDLGLLRQPFEAQAHVIEASRKALLRQKVLLVVGEMGDGKGDAPRSGRMSERGASPFRSRAGAGGVDVPPSAVVRSETTGELRGRARRGHGRVVPGGNRFGRARQ
jgi:hypothetical protein